MGQGVNMISGLKPLRSDCDGPRAPEKKAGAIRHENPDIRKAAQGLESLFIYELLKSMRAAVPKSGLFHGGGSNDQYVSMFDLKLAEHLAKKGELGIASMVERQLEKGVGKEDAPGAKVLGRSADD